LAGNAAIVRIATPDDAEQLIALVHANEGELNLTNEPGEFNMSVEEERAFLANFEHQATSEFFIAEVDGQVVGSLGMRGNKRRATRHVVSIGIAVHPQFRGQGIGSALLQRGLEWAKETGTVRRIELTVYARNEGAIRLYQRCGFVEEGRHRDTFCKSGEYIDSLTMAMLIE
jgi:RimJ/RimL family protein N-acetyltransferase